MVSLTSTLPYHYSATFAFDSLPAGNLSLRDYADAFLRAYDALSGRPFDPAQHEKNLAFTGSSWQPEQSVASAIMNPEEYLQTLPQEVQVKVRGLQEQLRDLLGTVYPLVHGETIEKHSVSMLKQELLDCPRGTVTYIRQTNLMRMVFLLPRISMDIKTASPNVARQPVRESHPPPPSHVHSAVALLSSDTWNTVSGVATNLAFVLPHPFGPLAAAEIAAVPSIFKGLFAAGPSTAAVVKGYIDHAVAEIKGFLTAMKLDDIQQDIEAFFQWCSSLINDDTSGWSQATVDNLTKAGGVLSLLENTYSFEHFTLRNNLASLGIEKFMQTNAYIARDADSALTVLLLSITAMICALKLTMQIASDVASFYAPDDTTGYCKSTQADQQFQDYTLLWSAAGRNLIQFILGTTQTPDSNMFTLDTIAKALTDVNFSSGSNPDYANIAKVFPVIGSNGPVVDGLPWSSIYDYANTYGWAKAVQQLVTHRQVARLAQITSVKYYDGRSTFCNYKGQCHTSGADGYRYDDLVDPTQSFAIDTDRWTSGCCNQNDHEQDHQYEVRLNWSGHFENTLKAIKELSTTGTPSWAGDLQIAEKWGQQAKDIQETLPPPMPVNQLVLLDKGWGGTAATGTAWEQAFQVQYAISYVDANGSPSGRSMFSALYEVEKRCKPTLTKIPIAAPELNLKRQIWRQFVFKDKLTNDPIYDLPKIVAVLGTSETTYVDVNPATTVKQP